MNRSKNLIKSVESVSKCSNHLEHVVVDWSSDVPLNTKDFPDDSRIRLYRVEGEVHWSLSKAYNFGISQCRGQVILKLDADHIIDPRFFECNEVSFRSFLANDFSINGALKKSVTGIFLVPKTKFDQVGGFNEYLQGWGYDDLDLFARLRGVCDQRPLNIEHIDNIEHGDNERVKNSAVEYNLKKAIDIKRITNLRNKWISEKVVWNRYTGRCEYSRDGGAWFRCNDVVVPEYLRGSLDKATEQIELQVKLKTDFSGISKTEFDIVERSCKRPIGYALIFGWFRFSFYFTKMLLKVFRYFDR